MQRKIIPDVVGDQDLINLLPSDTVRQAAKLMQQHNIGSILVLQDDRLKGIFTERDMVCRVVAPGLNPDDTTLDQVMTEKPDVVAPTASAMEALRLMDDGGYRHLPVVQRGRVVAIVSRRDFYGAEKARLDEEAEIWERIGY